MFSILDESSGDVLGAEITGGYTVEDFEAAKKAFEAVLEQGHARVNLLLKIDGLKLGESEAKAFIKDSQYALGHLNELRHVAIVGHSAVIKALTPLDNLLFGDKSKELVEKYFDVEEIEQAWAFVRS